MLLWMMCYSNQLLTPPPQQSLSRLRPRLSYGKRVSPRPPTMAAGTAATALPRLYLPSPSCPITSSSPRGRTRTIPLPGRRRLHLRLRSSPAGAAPAAAASSPSAPSSSDDSGIGDALGSIAVFSAATGEPILFRDLWDQNEGMAVVALLRHFGCPCCWELASVLRDAKDRFDSANIKLIAVGVGTPNKARMLAERLPFPLDCLYADPERKAYNLLGLYFGIGRTFFNPASVKVFSRFDSLKEAMKSYTIEATPDDRAGVLQQGGMFVFKGKELLYARKDEGTGDHAPLDDVLNVCTVPVA